MNNKTKKLYRRYRIVPSDIPGGEDYKQSKTISMNPHLRSLQKSPLRSLQHSSHSNDKDSNKSTNTDRINKK